jgi:hypothetical protein
MPIQNPLAPNYISEKHGRLWVPANASAFFSGGNQAPVATALPAGLTATYTGGLVLYNPIGSTVNLSISAASCAFAVAQTNAAVIGLGVGYSATVAPTTPGTAIAAQPNNVGSAIAAQGVLYSNTSLGLPSVPYLARILGGVGTGPTSGSTLSTLTSAVDGGILLPPGGYCCFTSSAAGTASSFVGDFVWEECSFAEV